MNNFFYYFTSFIIAVYFIVSGILCLLLPWLPSVRELFVEAALNSSLIVFFIGVCFVFVGAGIASYVIVTSKRRTYHYRKGKHLVDVDQDVIDGYLSTYLFEQFPNIDVPHQLIIRKKKILVAADLPYIPESEQPDFTEKVYQGISSILSDKIGCKSELYLSVSFQTPPK